MAVVGERPKQVIGNSSVYRKHAMFPLAEAYLNTVTDVLHEGLDVTSNIRGAVQNGATKEALKSFFVENSYDEKEFEADPAGIEEAIKDMEALFENDVQGILEDVQGNQINPIVGMTFPMHKWILMNMVFDKGGIPKFVAASPKFTITQEIRLMIDKDGNEIDMFKQQNLMTAAMDATVAEKVFDMNLPITDDTELVMDKLGGLAADHLAVETNVYAVFVPGVYFEVGDLLPDADGYIQEGNEIATTAGEHDVWVRTGFEFVPTYNMGREFDRALTRKFAYQYKSFDGTDVTVTELVATLFGSMKKDRIALVSNNTEVTKVRIKGRLDTSSARNTTCSVSWTQDSRLVEIGNGVPMNTTISPNEVKDMSALFNVNQVTKVMSLTKTAQGNYKDDKIKQELDESFVSMDPSSKLSQVFDFAPRITYSSDHVQWRKDTFLDFLDQHVTFLFQVLNDPNMKVAIFGDPKLVRMVTPTTYQYQSPNALGPVELDYTKTVYTSDKRNYSFIGSDKLRGTNEFIVVLNPEGSDRIMYRIYDYQYYMSNEIRNADNPALPAIHSFERWKFVKYSPVQGRINILHPSGINDETYNVIPTKAVTP